MNLKSNNDKIKIQNIQYMPSNRGPKGAFCCTDNGVTVGCTSKGIK